MEQLKRDVQFNPLTTANLFSRVFFCWVTPLFSIGNKRRLEEDDMYQVLPDDASQGLGEELQRHWDKEVRMAAKELRMPKLTKAIVRCYGKPYAVLGIFSFAVEVVKVIQPVFLGKLIQYFEKYDPNNMDALYEAFGYAAGVSLSTVALTVLQSLYFYHVLRTGMKIRVAMCHMIYKKALCLSSAAMGRTTTGQIVNLLSNDVNRFDEVTTNLHYLWIAPLQAVVVIILLWYEIGPSCLAGVAVLLFLMPLQTMFGKLFGSLRSKTAVLTDSRIRTMNEVVSGIRIIKMYAWEKPFSALVNEVRRKEISKIMSSSVLRGLNMASFFAASKIIVFITFAVYVLLGNTISASRVFVAVSLYGAIKLTVTLFFPLAIEKVFETIISIRRIKNFLLLDEIERPNMRFTLEEKKDASVEIKDLICYWDKCLDAPSLQNLSLTVKSEQLVVVIGPVGAGKSSLLSAILGELPHDKGVLRVKGQLTYASQQPWVFPGTIRSNILFGKELHPQKYEKVLRACALKRDMELLPDGDLTLIGDRGATLSGGQKARVNLARAVYQDADIYLLDDPLSCIFLTFILLDLQNNTRGTYSELQHSGVDFTSLLKRDEEEEPQTNNNHSVVKHAFSQNSISSHTSSMHSVKDGADQLPEELVQTVAEESRSEGNIGASLYFKYLNAGASILVMLGTVLLSLIAEVAYVLQDWWLAYWAGEQEKLNINSTMIVQNGLNITQELDLHFYMGIYAGLTLASVIFGFARSLLMFNVLVKAAQSLHNRMFISLLRTPVRFFDINPIGRILNRFSKDIGQLDSMLPITFVDFSQLILQNIGVVAVAAAVMPWILIPVVPLLIIFLFLRRYFLQTSRDVKRLESTTRSPVFSHLSSSLQGLWTIRAFRAEERFQNTFDTYQDLHTESWFLFLVTSRWFALRLDGICAAFVTVTAFGCLFLRDGLEAGAVGLVLSYAVTLLGNFQWTIRQSAEMENMMTSVERVVEYTELESEAPWETQKHPPPEWPSQGLITFDRVSFSYSSDGPVVLKDMKAMFRPKEKVGIVGRTGAGKSSLVSALFRLAEPEGRIYIDGVLTSEIGLHDLRQKMSIIPQDPVLFTGTMRKNLDPFHQYTDEDLWNALQEVQLKSVVEELPNKMETVLAESGSNFSVGQRQLVCLARAVLRKNRIIIIDEATANVDPRTDELIQKTIRDKFRECTVLTIAHRLNTIIDSDRILVLGAGMIQEFDEPYVLLQNQESALYRTVQQMGKAEAASLLESAKQVNTDTPWSKNGHGL
uniref:Multidrug resistance-associated protein 4 n=1 Tax=Oncorhynchus kisutch TaxID=8019 RepID=A0A8C7FHN7_ONCKI